MTLGASPASLELVPCAVCQRDIPLSEAVVAEAIDYVAYFCGLECYDLWRRRRDALTPTRRGQLAASDPAAS